MARKLRIQYGGAIYHVINRGNYRRDLFESAGAGDAFLKALFEAVEIYGWRIHAYVLMRNHYHLALETPDPNLVDGMHWLQSTIATRFNRFRRESGHLFQGRYQSLLVEDMSALRRLVDYIHLNPVRAKVVPPEQVKNYRWSSLARLGKVPRTKGLVAKDWLAARGGWSDNAAGWKAYESYLTKLAADEAQWEREEVVGLSKGWAIGSAGWRRAIAKDHAALALNPGMERAEIEEIRQATWSEGLADALRQAGKNEMDLKSRPLKQPWKLKVARQLRDHRGAPITWLADRLAFGRPATLRSYLSRSGRNAQTTA